MTIHHDLDRAASCNVLKCDLDAAAWRRDGRGSMTLRKRAFDVSMSLLLLVPLSMVMLVVALVLLVTQGRPLLYVASRMRTPDQPFNQLKFRTMLCEECDSGATGGHKAWRITPVGRFLRRTRIDELPQLFNILFGDMSFVGPRPPLREFVERFPAQYAQVLRNRPGVTGLATMIYHAHEDRIMAGCQTAEATEAAYYRRCLPTKLRLDMIYLWRGGLRMDMWIIWNTVMTVVIPHWQGRRRHGAATRLRNDRGKSAGKARLRSGARLLARTRR